MARRQLTHSNSKAVTLSCSAQVVLGVFANAAVAFVDHPPPIIYTSNTGNALDLITGLALFF